MLLRGQVYGRRSKWYFEGETWNGRGCVSFYLFIFKHCKYVDNHNHSRLRTCTHPILYENTFDWTDLKFTKSPHISRCR
jgi:hypothetical protein